MKKNILIISGIILLMVLVELVISKTFLFEHFELLTYDLRARLSTDASPFARNFNKADRDIVIVAIDDYSKKELNENPRLDLGPWPWKRDVWTEVVDFIEQGEPKAVMFDMVFEGLNENSWNDRKFAQDLRKYDNIVLGTYLDSPKGRKDTFADAIELEENNFLPTSKSLDVEISDKKLEDAITFYVNAPVHDIYTEYNTMGVVNKVIDADSEVRQAQPLFKLVKNDETYYMPSLSFAGFMKYMGEESKIVVKDNKILYKDRVIPIDDDGTLNINWHKYGRSYSYIPISKIFLNEGTENEIKPEFFKDKLVIIGQTAAGKNIKLDSVSYNDYVSPEATAVALDNFMNDSIPNDRKVRKFISEIPKPVQFFVTVFACLFVGVLVWVSKSAFVGCINGILSILLYILLSFWLFTNPSSRLLVPIAVPLYYLTVTSGIVFAFKFYKEMTRKTMLMDVFGKFVSPKVLANVLKNTESKGLKNTKKRISILFCDVKDFSGLSEKYEPEKLIENLNELFKEIVNIIFENNGTVDKFIGDCIMAYWSESSAQESDEFLAVKTALEIKKRVNELRVENAKEGKIIFDVKIGINTGEALLGLAGTDKIMSYTAMGDAVNVASRLESSCSTYKRDILISKSTYDKTKDKIVVLGVGKISIKGKEELIDVYEPIGLAVGTVNGEEV